MPHIVDPCYHLTDCTWSCATSDTAISEAFVRPMALYRSAVPEHARRISSISIRWQDGSSREIVFNRADPDLMIFSLDRFDEIRPALESSGKHLPDILAKVREKLVQKTGS